MIWSLGVRLQWRVGGTRSCGKRTAHTPERSRYSYGWMERCSLCNDSKNIGTWMRTGRQVSAQHAGPVCSHPPFSKLTSPPREYSPPKHLSSNVLTNLPPLLHALAQISSTPSPTSLSAHSLSSADSDESERRVERAANDEISSVE
jgi:hypothetical protein